MKGDTRSLECSSNEAATFHLFSVYGGCAERHTSFAKGLCRRKGRKKSGRFLQDTKM